MERVESKSVKKMFRIQGMKRIPRIQEREEDV